MVYEVINEMEMYLDYFTAMLVLSVSTTSAVKSVSSSRCQYYYSLKDISVGGMCICYGHAQSCPLDPLTKVGSHTCSHLPVYFLIFYCSQVHFYAIYLCTVHHVESQSAWIHYSLTLHSHTVDGKQLT